MIDGRSVLAVIPARGGSKGLPRKNVLDFANKPLIAWTIEAAKNSDCIDRVIVSTDDDEIAGIARSYGADIPYIRPAELATDTATTVAVVIELLEKVGSYDYVILLQPTSPLRTSTHINEAIALLKSKSADAIISVTELEHPMEWTNELPSDGCMDGFIEVKNKNKRRQDLSQRYRLNGAIYIARTKSLYQQKSFLLKQNVFAYIMSSADSVDIDHENDFVTALAIKYGASRFIKKLNSCFIDE